MNYFVTGATGFIGRHLVAELLEREGTIYVLVREGSRGKLDALVQRLGAPEGRIVPVAGDLAKPGLGVEAFDEPIDHLFHLAAVYDVEAEEEASERANVDGTRHVIEFANAHEVGRFHHTSSIAVAGEYRGVFQEDMFDEGQRLPHHYHRTKYESERLVRSGVEAKTLIFRPGIVVGHSETGEMDKVDGPYYFFKLLQRLRHALPEWVPLAGPQGGDTNIVPVDFVARAMDHIAHLPDDELTGDTYHLVEPRADDGGRDAQRVREGRPRAAAGDAPGPQRDERHPQAGAGGRDGAPHGQADPEPDLPRPGDPAGGDGEPRLPLQVRRPRLPARAHGHRHRGSPAVDLCPAPVGLLGAQPRPGPVPRAEPGQLDQGQAHPHHGRLERHRPRDRGEDRRGRRRGHPGLAHAREARGGGQAGGGRGRHRPRAPRGPLGPRRGGPPGGRGARAARRRGRAREQRRPLDPALGEGVLRPLPRLRAHDAAQLLRRPKADPGVPARDARAAARGTS